MSPLQHIKLHEKEFTKQELIIMDYVISHMDMIASHPITTIAEYCNVSKSALLRFAQKCGFQGYSELKYEISRFLQSNVQAEEDDANRFSNVLKLYVDQINKLSDKNLHIRMDRLSQLITNAHKIKIYGVHETGLSSDYFCFRLCTLGIDSEPVKTMMAEKASMSKPGDLNIFLSLSAQTPTICEAIDEAGNTKSTNVLITQNNHHKHRTVMDEVLILPTFSYEKEHIFLDSQALVFVTIDLCINHLAYYMHQKKKI